MADRVGVRIEGAAELTGVTTRNIRAYQSLGLVAPPRVEGRVGFYDPPHLERLRAIRHLQQRGFSLAGIKVLFDALDRGIPLEAVLDVEPGPPSLPGVRSTPPRSLRLALVPEPLASAIGLPEASPTAN